ncbi:MAG: HNH endonuclease signature motif containing protein [bacterium]|nr:HNH endonuclease signature motif containing protein [bacterium]
MEKDKAAEKARQRRKNPEHRKITNARTREYQNDQYANNPEWQAKAKRKSRIRKQGLGGKRPRRYAPLLAERDGLVCGICGGDVSPEAFAAGEFHVDHKHPVARAQTYLGNDINELSNLQLAHPSCNISKQDALPEHSGVGGFVE